MTIRGDFSGTPTFSEVLERVRGKILNAMANSACPFHLVVEELRTARDSSRTPCFQAMFAYQERSWHSLEDLDMSATGAAFDIFRFEHHTAKFEVHLQLRDGA